MAKAEKESESKDRVTKADLASLCDDIDGFLEGRNTKSDPVRADLARAKAALQAAASRLEE